MRLRSVSHVVKVGLCLRSMDFSSSACDFFAASCDLPWTSPQRSMYLLFGVLVRAHSACCGVEGFSRMRAIARRGALVAGSAAVLALAPLGMAHVAVAADAAPTQLLVCVGTQGNIVVVDSFSQCNRQQ